MLYEIQSRIATIGGYIPQGAHISDNKECAILNSFGYKLTRYDQSNGNLDYKYIYNGLELELISRDWNKKTGVLTLKLKETGVKYDRPLKKSVIIGG